MASRALSTVRNKLQGYADRGVFRSFHEVSSKKGVTEFSFLWLADVPFRFVLDETAGTIRFKNIVPNAPAGSELYGELKCFLRERSDPSLPSHRRIDPKRAEVSWSNYRGKVSITLEVKNNQYAYGASKAINLVNEVFIYLNSHFVEYMWETFNVPQE